jgi:large repetitive protein
MHITIAPATVTEGGVLSFPVTLTDRSVLDAAVTVQYATSNGSAQAPGDYAEAGGTLTFAPGDDEESISVSTVSDNNDEPHETLTVALSSPSAGEISGSPATGTITDDDAEPSLSISNVTEPEGNPPAGSTTFLFTVSLSAASGKQVTVNYATQNGTALSGSDYTHTTGSLTFSPGTTSQTIQVLVTTDGVSEPSENFLVNLSSPTNATGTPSGTGTIVNDDSQPSLSIEDETVAEGIGNATFSVTLNAPSGQTVQVNYSTSDGPSPAATGNVDYTQQTGGLLVFAPGETTKTVTVPITQDALDEPDEKFTVSLSNESNATVSKRDGIAMIADDDGTPSVSIVNAPAVTEGAQSQFPVTLSAQSGQAVTVNYALSHGTTTGGDFSTPPPLSGSITIPAGQTSGTIAIQTNDDLLDEADTEAFTVTISVNASSNATLGTPTSGTGTINDNDAMPTLSIGDGDAHEGNSGALGACGTPPPAGQLPTGCVFVKISLSAASGRTVTVQWSTANGTAVAPIDFAAVPPTTLTFAPGGALSQTVGVPIVGDIAFESNETFNVNLSAATNATITDGQGVGRILDEDSEPRLTVTGAQEVEGNPEEAVVVVALAPAAGVTVTVSFSTSNGTAIAGADYTAIPPSVFPCSGPAGATSCTLTFTPGQTSKAVTINLINDPFDEDDETFTVSLSNEQNAKILNGEDRRGLVTIRDDDPLPSVSISDATVTEGNSGAVSANFNVTLSAASGRAVSVNYATGNGSAVAPADYAGTSGALTFAGGETSKTVTVPVSGDEAAESDENFFVDLSQPNAATIGDGQGVGTILDDDAPPPRPPPPPPPTTDTTTTTTTSATTTTTSTTTTRTTAPSVLTGMKISNAPVVLLDNLAPIGVTCPRTATKLCFGIVVVQGRARTLAIVDGRPTAKAVTLGRESFAIPRGRSGNVLVPLSRRAVKAVKRAGRLQVTVVVSARDSAGKRANPIRRTLLLKSAKKPRPKRTRS